MVLGQMNYNYAVPMALHREATIRQLQQVESGIDWISAPPHICRRINMTAIPLSLLSAR